MRVLVTGATGKVGHGIAAALLERGDEVRALAREPDRAAEVLPSGARPLILWVLIPRRGPYSGAR